MAWGILSSQAEALCNIPERSPDSLCQNPGIFFCTNTYLWTHLLADYYQRKDQRRLNAVRWNELLCQFFQDMPGKMFIYFVVPRNGLFFACDGIFV
jgi:hypothetical protein